MTELEVKDYLVQVHRLFDEGDEGAPIPVSALVIDDEGSGSGRASGIFDTPSGLIKA